jgi:hypothetical protein
VAQPANASDVASKAVKSVSGHLFIATLKRNDMRLIVDFHTHLKSKDFLISTAALSEPKACDFKPCISVLIDRKRNREKSYVGVQPPDFSAILYGIQP